MRAILTLTLLTCATICNFTFFALYLFYTESTSNNIVKIYSYLTKWFCIMIIMTIRPNTCINNCIYYREKIYPYLYIIMEINLIVQATLSVYFDPTTTTTVDAALTASTIIPLFIIDYIYNVRYNLETERVFLRGS